MITLTHAKPDALYVGAMYEMPMQQPGDGGDLSASTSSGTVKPS